MYVQRQPVLDVHRAVVASVAVALVEADQRSHAVGRLRGFGRRAGRLAFRAAERIAAQLQLGKDDEVGAAGARLGDHVARPARIRVEIPQQGVDLRQSDSHPTHLTRAVAYG